MEEKQEKILKEIAFLLCEESLITCEEQLQMLSAITQGQDCDGR